MKKHNFFHYMATILVYLIKGIISEFIWLFVGIGGFLVFQTRKSPYDLLIGLPLVIISIGFILNSFLSEYLAVFSPRYNKGVCVLCGK